MDPAVAAPPPRLPLGALLALASTLAACGAAGGLAGPPPTVRLGLVGTTPIGSPAAVEVTGQTRVEGLALAGGQAVVTLQAFASAPGGADPVRVYERPFSIPANANQRFEVAADFSLVPEGERDLVFRAVDALGRHGDSTPARVLVVQAPPVIESLTASPATVRPSQLSTLSWSVKGLGSIQLSLAPLGAVAGSSRGVFPTATTTYTLTARNAAGSTSKAVTVTVSPGS